jgi:hypothetical protein
MAPSVRLSSKSVVAQIDPGGLQADWQEGVLRQLEPAWEVFCREYMDAQNIQPELASPGYPDLISKALVKWEAEVDRIMGKKTEITWITPVECRVQGINDTFLVYPERGSNEGKTGEWRRAGTATSQTIRRTGQVDPVGMRLAAVPTIKSDPRIRRGRDGLWIDDLDSITQDEYGRISAYMTKLGYDSRGADDAKRAIGEHHARGVPLQPDWVKAVAFALGLDRQKPGRKPSYRSYFQKAVKHFGVTEDPRECGYLLPDGTMLDLSFSQAPGTRGKDHREVAGFIPSDESGTESMRKFIGMGVIRVMPHSTLGLDISVEPTAQQYQRISQIVDSLGVEVALDLEGPGSKENRVVPIQVARAGLTRQIQFFYATGKLPPQSGVQQFHQTEEEPPADQQDAQKPFVGKFFGMKHFAALEGLRYRIPAKVKPIREGKEPHETVFFGLLSKNTRPGEKPYRFTVFYPTMLPATHFPLDNPDVSHLNILEGIQGYVEPDVMDCRLEPLGTRQVAAELAQTLPEGHPWGVAGRYGGGEADRGIWYHGTTSDRIRTILKEGLVPDGKPKSWANDPDSSWSSPSRQTYGGVYLAKSLMTALSACRNGSNAKRVTGNQGRALVIVELQPRTLVHDEDRVAPQNYLYDPSKLLTTENSAAWMWFSKEFGKDNPELAEWVRDSKDVMVRFYRSRLDAGGVKADKISPQEWERAEAILRDEVWPATVDRAMAYYPQSQGQYWKSSWTSEFRRYTAQEPPEPFVPDKETSETAYRNAVQKLTVLLRRSVKDQGYSPVGRSLQPIGFSGSNHIVCVLELVNNPDLTDSLKVVYGTPPEQFLKDWKEAIGEVRFVGGSERAAQVVPSMQEEYNADRQKKIDDAAAAVCAEITTQGRGVQYTWDFYVSRMFPSLKASDHSLHWDIVNASMRLHMFQSRVLDVHPRTAQQVRLSKKCAQVDPGGLQDEFTEQWVAEHTPKAIQAICARGYQDHVSAYLDFFEACIRKFYMPNIQEPLLHELAVSVEREWPNRAKYLTPNP